MNLYQNRFAEKLREALTAVSPTIECIAVKFYDRTNPTSILLLFLFGAVMLIIGMMFLHWELSWR